MKGAFNVDNTKELTHISLCAGYGGIDIGLKRVIGDVRTIAFSEIEAYAVANLVSKMEKGFLDAAPVWSNLKTFPWEEFHKKVDIISGGFPCQPFSAAGTRGGDSDPRHLWPYIKRGIELARPALVFLENVQGILSAKLKGTHWEDEEGTPVLLHIFRELERVGYRPTAGIFSACEVGATHQRKRVFILAVSNELTGEGYDKINSLIKPPERLTPYPAPRGCEQYEWEAPRTVSKKKELGNPNSNGGGENREQSKGEQGPVGLKQRPRSAQELGNPCIKGLEGKISKAQSREEPSESTTRSSASRDIQGLSKLKMGRTVDGAACGMDTSDMLTSFDNRTDELRLLGNGVVPDTASRAFFKLWKELGNPHS